MKTKLTIFLLSLALFGCTEPVPHYDRLQVAVFYGNEVPAKKPYGSVIPYYTQQDVPGKYRAVAFMSCEGNVNEEAAIMKAMLYRAADLGADGILLSAKGFGQDEGVDHSANTPYSQSTQNMNINVRWGWMSMIGNSSDRCMFRAQAICITPK